ncbi:DNA polymerase III subunit delta' [Ameyamaea chiangmaiensis]|nr:DNA polymerase III subunit delta' [Ameyamaea chiangmaiensis]
MVGHDSAAEAFRAALSSARLHHAWLMAGPPGIGKASLALQFARILLKAEDPASPAGRRVSAGTHADLLMIARGIDEKRGRQRTEIVADDIRPAGDFLRRTAAEGGWRVVVIDGADHMNRNAANALLKILEEPPPRALLLLTCDAPGRLLPTIRSRCRLLKLEPLSDVAMIQALRAHDVDDTAARAILGPARGSPARALQLLGASDASMAEAVDALLDGRRPDGGEYVFAEGVARGDNGFPAFFTLLCEGVSARARGAARDGRRDGEALRRVRQWDALNRIRSETERANLDKLQAVLSALTIMSET